MNYYPRRNGFQGGGQRNGNQNGQPRDMQGKAWQQTRSQHPKAPQFTGVITVLGVDYRVSVWIEHDPQRGDVLSMKLQPKQDARRQSFQNSGGYSGYVQPQQQQSGFAHSPSGFATSGYPTQPPHNSGYSPPQNAPQPQQQYTSNRSYDAQWPDDGAPMPNADDYGAEPF